jgi:hypothetical protein
VEIDQEESMAYGLGTVLLIVLLVILLLYLL